MVRLNGKIKHDLMITTYDTTTYAQMVEKALQDEGVVQFFQQPQGTQSVSGVTAPPTFNFCRGSGDLTFDHKRKAPLPSDDNKIDYAIKVHGVEISPDPVVIGKPVSFIISASTGQDIPGGKVVIKVSYFGLQVHTETHNLCEEISCPIAAGNFVLSHSQTLPGFAPPNGKSESAIDGNKLQKPLISVGPVNNSGLSS
uniref:MD-2-related lipid-recognition domain-containing protein n=1 Tax=Cannabis sativa TaxID=3483 RepID=A0A803PY06_CANSA